MNFRKIIVEEREKNNILSSYGLVTEQNTTPKNVLNVTKNLTFKGGKYKIIAGSSAQVALDAELAKAKAFLKQGAGKSYIVAVKLEAGESQLPNYDTEMSPPQRVDVGYLSNKRMEEIESYITKSLQEFVNSKLLLKLPGFEKTEPKVGATKWVGQKFCPSDQLPGGDTQGYECSAKTFAPKSGGKAVTNWATGKQSTYATLPPIYKKEQFMKVTLKLIEIGEVKKCLDNMVIEVNYTDVSKGHVCNYAKYEITLNGIKLKNEINNQYYASLNNDGVDDNTPTLDCNQSNKYSSSNCKRFNKFIVKPSTALKALEKAVFKLDPQGKPSFDISAKCLSKGWDKDSDCHEGVGNIIVTNGLGKKYFYDSATPNKFGQVKPLVNLDACGAGKVAT